MKKVFRPSFAYLHQLFKRKTKRKNEKRTNTTAAAARPPTANTAVTTTTSSGGSHIPPDSSECYDREPVWRSWSLVHPPSSSSSSSSSSENSGEAEAQGGEQQSPLGQNARCAANKNKNRVSQTMEAWWMDPYLMGAHHRSYVTMASVVRGSSRRGRVVQGEGAWWTEQRYFLSRCGCGHTLE